MPKKPKDCPDCKEFSELGSTNMCDSCERKAKRNRLTDMSEEEARPLINEGIIHSETK